MVEITKYILKDTGDKGIKHWIAFKYDANLIDKIKRIPPQFRSYDRDTKMWGFNDRGWNLLTAISDIKIPYYMKPEGINFLPRKVDESLEDVDWNKFDRPATDDQPKLSLWPFQKVGISQIIRNKAQGLFLEMALGKTYTAICAAKELIDRGNIKQALIISMVGGGVLLQWERLLKRMGYSYTLIKEDKMVDRPQVYANCDTDFVLTLYTSLLSHGPVNKASDKSFADVFVKKAKKNPQMLVVDELHKLGDVTSATFRELNQMAKAAEYRVPLTGTVIKSTPEKALLPLRFIDPVTFSRKSDFDMAFTIEEQGTFGTKIVGYKNLSRLKEIIHSYGTVALKKDYLNDLPEVLPVKELIVDTSKDSYKVLRSIRGDETLDLVRKNYKVNYADLKDLYIRIHQALVCPSVFSDDLSARNMLNCVEDILDSVEGKTVIFTTLIAAVNEISNFLKAKGINHVVCCGDLTDKEVESRINLFKSDNNYNVMIATVQKMGTGYDDLKVAQNCIIYDFNMVAGDLRQATERLNRPGQKNKISIFEITQDNVFSQYQREKIRTQEKIIYQTEDKIMKGDDQVELANLIKMSLEAGMFGRQ